MATIVDVHCHTFNADDLPVQGFLHKVAFGDRPLARELAALVDRVLQGRAPGYAAESARLDTLLGGAPLPEAAVAEMAPDPAATLEAEVDRAFADLAATDADLLRRVGVQLASEGAPPPPDSAQEGLLDWLSASRRAVRWALLYGAYRLDNTATLLTLFSGRVDLAVPLLVDLGMGLGDTAKTTQRQQVELQEKISRLSLRDALPGGARGHVHGFVGFDPRRELRARRVSDVDTPLALIADAVARYGVVGVKLYPPMGFMPLGNVGAGVRDGAELDGIMRDLFAWCVAEQVPVTAHGNASNHAAPAYATFGSPEAWGRALAEFPDLHVNVGHFGGTDDDQQPWRDGVARLAAAHPHVYADVGNHRIDLPDVRTRYIRILEQLFADPATAVMSERLMFGSDWYMLAIAPEHEQFLERYEQLYRTAFGGAATEAFLGGTALRFLGFDDPANANARRVLRRYRGRRVPDWLATA